MLPCLHLVGLLLVAQLDLSAATTTVAPLESLSFTASGGTKPYTFDLAADASGGSVTPDGVYTAGPTDAPDGGDRIRATDKLGLTGFASVTVENLYSPPPPATGCGAAGGGLSALPGLFLLPMLLARRRRE